MHGQIIPKPRLSREAGRLVSLRLFTARRPGLHGPGFVDHQLATIEVVAIEHFNGFGCLLVRVHFHKSEAAAAAREFVRNDAGRGYSAGLRKKLLQVAVCGLVGETPYEESLCHFSYYLSLA